MRRGSAIIVGVGLLLAFTVAAQAAATHGMSLFGDLKYGPDFKHFDYVNPDAPKGGTMHYSAIGTFDTLNPFVIKGIPAAGIGGVFDDDVRLQLLIRLVLARHVVGQRGLGDAESLVGRSRRHRAPEQKLVRLAALHLFEPQRHLVVGVGLQIADKQDFRPGPIELADL